MIKIVVTGDVSDWNIAPFDVERIPERLRAAIADADLFVPNLEGPIAVDGDYPEDELFENPIASRILGAFLTATGKRQPRVSSTPAIASLFRLGPETCITLANNHTKDLGRKGVADTVALLSKEGLPHIGAGMNRREANASFATTVRGKDLVVLNFNYVGLRKLGFYADIYGASRSGFGASHLAPGGIAARIRALRATSPDAFVILVLHAGRALAGSVEKSGVAYRAFEELGANCVVFHHSHRFLGAPSARSFFLGDFVFRHPDFLPEDRDGGFVELTVDPDSNEFEHRFLRYRFRDGYPDS